MHSDRPDGKSRQTQARLYVYEINSKIDGLLKVLSNTATYTKAQKQWMFQLVRLCMPSSMNYLLRTVHPDHTVDAAKTLDEYLVDFVLKLTACKGKYGSCAYTR